ncbi:MAG: potassium channel family protein [Candidatus Dormibacteria bacterium]
MHIVLVGCGRVGAGLAQALEAQGHSVAIIDKTRRAFRRLPQDFKGITVEGSGFDREALEEAQIERADALAAVTSGDNSNVLTARIARETYGIQSVVARIYDPRRAEIYQRLGIPTVATVTWTVGQVERWLLPERMTPVWSDATGSLLLVDRVLPDHLAGTRLEAIEVPGKIRLVAVSRAGVPRLDPRELVGQEGDLLHIAVQRSALPHLEDALTPTADAVAAS